MPYVYSTATSSCYYGKYIPSPATAHANKIQRKIRINGGANVAPLRDSKTTVVFATPLGAATRVTDEELAFLESCEAFIRHRDAGFLKVEKSNRSIEKVVQEMDQKKDGSAPITPADKQYLGSATPVMNPKE